MYFYCVSSRLWPSPLKRKNAGPDRAMLVADKLANGEEPKDARRGYAIAIAIMGRDYGAHAAGILSAPRHWRACRRQALNDQDQHFGA